MRLLVLFLAVLLVQPAWAQKRIAITFDDAPRDRGAFLTPAERTGKLIAALRQAGVKQAAFFINPGFLERPDGAGGEGRIADYVAAGHVIANHSWNHIALSKADADRFLADIDKAETWLRTRPGYRPWFRFPELDEGRTDRAKRDAVRQGLAARRLLNAQVTADGSDWFLEMLTVDAAKKGEAMDIEALRRLYVTIHISGIEYADALGRAAFGRSPAHVLLLHETDIAALFLGDLLAEMKRRGWSFVSADRAFADPIYKLAPDTPDSRGTLTNLVASEGNVPPPAWPFWIDPSVTKLLFDRTVLKRNPGALGIP